MAPLPPLDIRVHVQPGFSASTNEVAATRSTRALDHSGADEAVDIFAAFSDINKVTHEAPRGIATSQTTAPFTTLRSRQLTTSTHLVPRNFGNPKLPRLAIAGICVVGLAIIAIGVRFFPWPKKSRKAPAPRNLRSMEEKSQDAAPTIPAMAHVPDSKPTHGAGGREDDAANSTHP